MTTTEWISLVASIGALSAAFIALFTLFELFRQRKSSYQPDLTVLQNRFTLKPGKYGELDLALGWEKSGNEESDLSFGAQLAVVNIGFGAAKNVVAKWSFDKDALLDKVNNLAQKNHQPFYIEKSNNMLAIKNKGQSGYMVNDKMNSVEFEYLLPLSQDDTGREIMLPPSYTMLVSTYLSLMAIGEFNLSQLKIPRLTLELNYSDIGKGKHKSTHKIECKMSSMTKKEGGGDASFRVHLLENS